MLETYKGNKGHKAYSIMMKGLFLRFAWRSVEYLIGTEDGMLTCRALRRRAEAVANDPDRAVFLEVSYVDYVFKGAKTTPMISFSQNSPA